MRQHVFLRLLGNHGFSSALQSWDTEAGDGPVNTAHVDFVPLAGSTRKNGMTVVATYIVVALHRGEGSATANYAFCLLNIRIVDLQCC